MAQHNWAYTSSTGRQYVVGLYHGKESGHLIAYCNLRIMLVEFSILQDYSYSFFIEDDLLEIKIERKGEDFCYFFQVNKEADTPKNRARKIQQKREQKQMILSLIIVGILMLLFLGTWWYNESRISQKDRETLQTNAWQVPAKIFFQPGDTKLTYTFVADGKSLQGKTALPNDALLPLESGDEFMVRYLSPKPWIHQIDFSLPSPKQLKRYRQKAFEQHTRLHPELTAAYVECLLNVAFEQKGAAAYADFFFQQSTPENNPNHNRNTYGRLVRDIPFQNKVDARCDKLGFR